MIGAEVDLVSLRRLFFRTVLFGADGIRHAQQRGQLVPPPVPPSPPLSKRERRHIGMARVAASSRADRRGCLAYVGRPPRTLGRSVLLDDDNGAGLASRLLDEPATTDGSLLGLRQRRGAAHLALAHHAGLAGKGASPVEFMYGPTAIGLGSALRNHTSAGRFRLSGRSVATDHAVVYTHSCDRWGRSAMVSGRLKARIVGVLGSPATAIAASVGPADPTKALGEAHG